MNWPWTRDRVLPYEKVYACPDCESTQPAYPVAALANFVLRHGAVIGIVTGHRVLCEKCGKIYCVGPNGVFKSIIDTKRPVKGQMDEQLEQDDDGSPPSMGIPLDRPDV